MHLMDLAVHTIIGSNNNVRFNPLSLHIRHESITVFGSATGIVLHMLPAEFSMMYVAQRLHTEPWL